MVVPEARSPRPALQPVGPPPVLDALLALVVAVPEGEARVVVEAGDVVVHLGAHLVEEELLGVGGTREGEVLPDEQAELVAGVV